MGMSPPTSTGDKQGTVIDGKLRSAEWREKERAAQRSQGARSPASGADVPATDFDPAAAKDFVSSLMIPARSLAGERPEPEASGAHGNAVLTESRDLDPSSELKDEASETSAKNDELDRWFEDQATSVPCAPAAQKLPRGSASLEVETAAPGRKSSQRVRAIGRRRVRTRGSDTQRLRPARQQRLRSRARVRRTWVLAGVTLVIVCVGAVAIISAGAPAHRSRVSSIRASISTPLAGLLGMSRSKADLLAAHRSFHVRVQRHRGPSHRTHRAARPRPITHHARSTVASTSAYKSPPSSVGGWSSPAANASASTGGGVASSPPTSTTSSSGSSPPSGSSQQPRTGPTGPISLIGAGTTPSS